MWGRAGCGACGERREPARDATRAAVGHRMCSAVCVRPPGWRRARLGAKEMRVAARPQVCGRGALPADEKSSNWSSRAGRPGGEPEACVSTGARVPREGASAQRRTRPVKTKKKKGGRPKGTDSRGGAPDARPKTHALQKRHAAPRARAGGHAARSSDCGGEAGGGLGGNGERRWSGRCDVDRRLPAAPGARERRGAACADLLPDTFPPLPVNGCRFGREPASLAGGG